MESDEDDNSSNQKTGGNFVLKGVFSKLVDEEQEDPDMDSKVVLREGKEHMTNMFFPIENLNLNDEEGRIDKDKTFTIEPSRVEEPGDKDRPKLTNQLQGSETDLLMKDQQQAGEQQEKPAIIIRNTLFGGETQAEALPTTNLEVLRVSPVDGEIGKDFGKEAGHIDKLKDDMTME